MLSLWLSELLLRFWEANAKKYGQLGESALSKKSLHGLGKNLCGGNSNPRALCYGFCGLLLDDKKPRKKPIFMEFCGFYV